MSNPSSKHLADAERIIQLEKQLAWAELKIRVLEERLRLQRIKKYGPGSEKLTAEQLELLELEPGVSAAEVQAEGQREPLPESPTRSHKPRRHPGRQELPAGLPRVERVIACTTQQCTCATCGSAKAIIGYDVSEQLDVEPAHYVVVVTKREKRACPQCQDGVSAARLPARIIEKGLVSDRVVIDTVVAKYSDHLPLYRQSAILQRETGVEIGRGTMDGWVMQVGELLLPIAEAMRRELLAGTYIQADETTVDVQTHDGRGQNHQAYLWQYGRPGGTVVFDFRLGRGRDGPQQFLENFEGILQTDGYGAYDRVGGPNIVRAACWAHARRQFIDAVKLNPTDATATGIVARIDELFAVDALARVQNLDCPARHSLRMERARPLVETIRQEIEAARSSALPSSALGKAANYSLSLWQKLTRFLENPELELSNNLAENSMRPIAVGRKNWIHIGSRQAGPKVAAILSVVETCRRMKIRVREYLAAVLPGLAATPVPRAAHLTPLAWAANRQA